MTELRIESTRSGLVESVHRVSVVVVNAQGGRLAVSGDPDFRTFWRSCAKPFQAIPVIADGAADRFGFGPDAIALACASHSSEPPHRALAAAMLQQLGLGEAVLACGPHPPLGVAVADEIARDHLTPTPVWSNCSGKHAGMLALALAHDWPTSGYECAGHPVQDRLLAEMSRWTGVAGSEIALGTDGCTAVSYALPLSAMALAYARLAVATDEAPRRVREAMMGQPYLVAGNGRLCTDLMAAGAGKVLVKLGADGMYGGALLPEGIGFTLKVEDGDMRCAAPALVGVLRALASDVAPWLTSVLDVPAVRRHEIIELKNTRGGQVGSIHAVGGLRYLGPSRTIAVTATH